MNNISQIEKTEESRLDRMSQSELYASALMENANDAIFVVAMDGKILNANRKAEKLLGLSWEDIEGRFYHEFVVSDDYQHAISEVENVIGGNSVIHSEVRLKHAKGGIVFVDFSAVVIDLGNEKVMMSIGRDITAQKRMEEERNRLAAIVESSDDAIYAIYAINLEGVINVWNSGAEKLFGYSQAEILGRYISTLVPADHHKEILRMLDACKQGQVISHFETVRKNRQQAKFPISLSWFPILDRNGKVIGVSAIVRDLTEQKRGEFFLSREEQ